MRVDYLAKSSARAGEGQMRLRQRLSMLWLEITLHETGVDPSVVL